MEEKSQPKVSVIIPVYNVEKYIEKCLHSLFSQTLDDLEYIFIDDCSPDRSFEAIKRILEEYPSRKHQVKLIRHEKNQGVGVTRQDGIDVAIGEYVIHCDPDDWIEPQMYESLYREAISKDADVVICDYFINSSISQSVRHQYLENSPKELFASIANSSFHTALWNKLVRRSLAQSIRIPYGVNLWEDMSYSPRILFEASGVVKVDAPLYHYRIDNSESIVHSVNRQSTFSKIEAVKTLVKYFEARPIFKEKINWDDMLLLQWSAKRDFIYNPTKSDRDLWLSVFPEVNNAYHNLNLSFKSKALAICAKYNLLFLIRLYDRNKYKRPSSD